MNCEEAQDMMASFVANQELPQMSSAFADHLQTCAECRAWLEEVQQTWQLWQARNPAEMTILLETEKPIAIPNLVASVMQRLNPAAETIWPVNARVTLWHYGIAASLTLALSQFGIPQLVGLGLAGISFTLSAKLQALLQYVSYL